MRAKWSKVNRQCIFCLVLLILLPIGVSAESDTDNQIDGSLQMKMERIQENNRSETEYRETELEKQFPDLFKSETEQVIDEKVMEQGTEKEQVLQHIFLEDVEENQTIEHVKNQLFQADYDSAAAFNTGSEEENQQAGSSANTIILISLITFATLLSIALYFSMQKFLT
ncbi:type VII secretion protein EssA [Oceanobacillus sp. CFH 90083]|uniref:type VII secretion protein EssA n=1 Tax=Oceanobacillus sp. CFH 90083 TaxID=2592336 RepID=UPI0018836922|nr:type VII secretion protein EssA [Oceanobacillus sp. CFH 90083]